METSSVKEPGLLAPFVLPTRGIVDYSCTSTLHLCAEGAFCVRLVVASPASWHMVVELGKCISIAIS
jgi:hypothetical protein